MKTVDTTERANRDECITTNICLATHNPSGELYVLRISSEWVEDEWVGASIVEAVGGLERREFLGEAGQPLPDWVGRAVMTMFDNPVDAVDDAEWANEQKWTILTDHREGQGGRCNGH